MTRALLALALAALATACADEPVDTPAVAAKKVECRALLAHVFRISPEAAPKFAGKAEPDAQHLAEAMVAALPPEDIDQCVAADPAIIACMRRATDVAGVAHCAPITSSATP